MDDQSWLLTFHVDIRSSVALSTIPFVFGCGSLFSQTRAEKALAQEPEVKQMVELQNLQTHPRVNSGGAGAMQVMNANKAIWILQQQLRQRLKEELLYVCHGTCPVKEEEVVLLQQIIDKDNTSGMFEDPNRHKWRKTESEEIEEILEGKKTPAGQFSSIA